MRLKVTTTNRCLLRLDRPKRTENMYFYCEIIDARERTEEELFGPSELVRFHFELHP